MAHTFDVAKADRLDDVARYRYCSRDELVALVGPDVGRLADLGSGTGFYTRDLAPFVDVCYGIDVQREMHVLHGERGVHANVRLVTGTVDALPLADDSLDAAVSTVTFHEFCTPTGLEEVARVLRPGGRFVTVDWSANGTGTDGPSLDERQTADSAASLVRDAGFAVEHRRERPETFVLVATLPAT